MTSTNGTEQRQHKQEQQRNNHKMFMKLAVLGLGAFVESKKDAKPETAKGIMRALKEDSALEANKSGSRTKKQGHNVTPEKNNNCKLWDSPLATIDKKNQWFNKYCSMEYKITIQLMLLCCHG